MGRSVVTIAALAAVSASLAASAAHEANQSPEVGSFEKAPAPKVGTGWHPKPPAPKVAPDWEKQQRAMDPTISRARFTARDGAMHVGNSDWVEVTKLTIQKQAGERFKLKAGAKCVIDRGARLVIRGGEVIYKTSEGLGTECPSGASIDLSPAQAKAQDRRFQGFIHQEAATLSEVSELSASDRSNTTEEQNWHWVNVIDSPPENQGNVNYEYGDICGVEGAVEQMGQLSTGESVMRIQELDQSPGGTVCPAGTVFLNPDNRTMPNWR